jgi:predicted Zn-dependent protease
VKFDPALPEDGINVTPSHPLRELALLLGGLCAVSAVLIVALVAAVEHLVPLLPPDLEARWLSGWARESEPDPRASRVQVLLDRLAGHWPENPYAFRVDVLEQQEPNAFALPGGWIAVTSGLLEQVESENELALVLGHELGHFRNRDHLRGLGRGLALALVLGGLGLAESEAAGAVASVAASLTDRAFGRAQELDADAFGLSIVYAEYGHLAGAFEFFARLPDPESIVERRAAHYLATHPLNDERIDALRARAREAGWPLAGKPSRFEFARAVDATSGAGPEPAAGAER